MHATPTLSLLQIVRDFIFSDGSIDRVQSFDHINWKRSCLEIVDIVVELW